MASTPVVVVGPGLGKVYVSSLRAMTLNLWPVKVLRFRGGRRRPVLSKEPTGLGRQAAPGGRWAAGTLRPEVAVSTAAARADIGRSARMSKPAPSS
jgi:hypothetical protein